MTTTGSMHGGRGRDDGEAQAAYGRGMHRLSTGAKIGLDSFGAFAPNRRWDIVGWERAVPLARHCRKSDKRRVRKCHLRNVMCASVRSNSDLLVFAGYHRS
jgi:hypothetical protein